MQQKRMGEDVDTLRDCITDIDITTNQINSKLDHMVNIRPGDIDITQSSPAFPPSSLPVGPKVSPPDNSSSGTFPPRPAYVRRRAAACSLLNSDIEEETV